MDFYFILQFSLVANMFNEIVTPRVLARFESLNLDAFFEFFRCPENFFVWKVNMMVSFFKFKRSPNF